MSKETKKIKFTTSPTGAYKLAYSVGEEAELEKKQADDLIDHGYAIPVVEEATVVAKSPSKMNLTELRELAESKGLEVSEEATKKEILSLIKSN